MANALQMPPAGLAEVAGLVHECWLRPSTEPDRPLPVIALLGRPGSGKTHALDHLEGVTEGAPVARIDFAAAADQRPHEVALHLAFLLARKHRGSRPLRFPRLLLGLLAVQPQLSLTDRGQATRELRGALRRARNRGAAADAGEGIAGLVETLGLSPVPGIDLIIGVLLRGFEYMPAGTFLNRALASYGSPGSSGSADALEELVELNRRARSRIPTDRGYVDRRLCLAFLEDLGAGYARGRREHNCLALLDDIDRNSGSSGFLETLLSLRTERARSEAYDPLLVVAAGATTQAVPGPSDGSPDDPHIHRPEGASYAAWRARSGRPLTEWWYPVRLRDLDEVEVALEASRHESETARRTGRPEAGLLTRSTPLVHRLTYGHPWSVLQLHTAIDRLLEHTPDDLRGLLDTPVPRAGPAPDAAPDSAPDAGAGPGAERGSQLATAVRAYLLTGLTDSQRTAATRIAAARTPKSAVNSGLLNGQPEHARDTVMRELRNRLWLTRPVPEDANTRGGTGPSGYLQHPGPNGDTAADSADSTLDGRPVLHPWLRLLLLDELSGPPAGSVEEWEAIHRTLADWHHRHGQPLDSLYHRLALNELQEVVRYFITGLTAPDLRPWLRELYHVTAAPMYRAQLSDAPPRRRAGELAREHAPEAYGDRARGRPLAELCAALWLAGDPRNRLPPGSPELNFKIGAMFRQLAMAADADADTLLDEAARYTD
ncbi:hypothetical protein ABZW18_19065 [Streptomyces sp. NPDC004647]|uniref:hypothetical protein n=1 Tax=Streptomyces sp. NPDC004647 TaxID=3154671 RepID=UPI0033B0D09B